MDTLHVLFRHRLRAFELDLEVAVGGETFALVGPSGAGKTTALRAVAGLLRPDSGRIAVGASVWLDRQRGIDVPPEQRSVGFVFQDYALFPHMTVAENVFFGGRARAAQAIELLGLEALTRARPADLSGGERQRVALARALARDPEVLLLDEPLAAVDAQARGRLRSDLRELLAGLGLPTLLVTHDFHDATALADRVGVLSDGRLVQTGAPRELVAAPATPFVAAFAGANLLRGRATRRGDGLTSVVLDDGTSVVSTDGEEGAVAVVTYPWDVSIARRRVDDSAQNHVTGTVASLVPLGNRVRVRVGDLIAEITAASAERLDLAPGEQVVASFKATATRLVRLE